MFYDLDKQKITKMPTVFKNIKISNCVHHKHGVNIVYENLTNIYEYRKFVDANQLCVLHVMKSGCSVCYAVLPQLDDLIQQFPVLN